MIRAIFDTIYSMGKRTEQKDIRQEITNQLLFTTNMLLPSIDNFIQNQGAIKSINDNRAITDLIYYYKKEHKHFKSGVDIFKYIRSIVKDIISNNMVILKVIDTLPETIVKDELTIREATILKIASDISLFLTYSMDVMLYITMVNDGDKDLKFNKGKLDTIRNTLPAFVKLSLFLEDIEKNVKSIEKVSFKKLHINEDDPITVEAIAQDTGEVIPLLNTSGFDGNPIMHLRLWWVDMEVNKIDAMKNKKLLLENKLQELRYSEDGEISPKVNKSIEYYLDEIDSLEYKIAKHSK